MLRKRIVVLSILIFVLALITFAGIFIWSRISFSMNKLRNEAKKFPEYELAFSSSSHYLERAIVKELRTMVNDYHVEVAQNLGVAGLKDEKDVMKAVEEKKLVPLKDTNFWKLRELTDSMPYVTPDTLELLFLAGKRFHENLRNNNLPLYRFTISSL